MSTFNRANILAVFLPVAASSSTEAVGVVAADELTSFSSLQLFRLPNVILALSTWNRGISAKEEPRGITRLYQNVVLIKKKRQGTSCTYFNRKSRGKVQGYKISQPCKMGTGPSHEVNDGGHLFHQGQRVFLTHPQCSFEPTRNKITESID